MTITVPSVIDMLWIKRHPTKLLVYNEEPRSADWDLPNFEFYRVDYDADTKIVKHIFDMRNGKEIECTIFKHVPRQLIIEVGERLPGAIFTFIVLSAERRSGGRFKRQQEAHKHPSG